MHILYIYNRTIIVFSIFHITVTLFRKQICLSHSARWYLVDNEPNAIYETFCVQQSHRCIIAAVVRYNQILIVVGF